jgi:hypothetical protein
LDTLTTEPSDATLTLTDLPGRTLADPGAVTAAQVGIAVTNRRTTSALMKPTLPLFDTTRRL